MLKSENSFNNENSFENDSIIIWKASWQSTKNFQQLTVRRNIIRYRLYDVNGVILDTTIINSVSNDLLKINLDSIIRKNDLFYKACSAEEHYYLMLAYNHGDTIKNSIPIEYTCDSSVNDYYIAVTRKIKQVFETFDNK